MWSFLSARNHPTRINHSSIAHPSRPVFSLALLTRLAQTFHPHHCTPLQAVLLWWRGRNARNHYDMEKKGFSFRFRPYVDFMALHAQFKRQSFQSKDKTRQWFTQILTREEGKDAAKPKKPRGPQGDKDKTKGAATSTAAAEESKSSSDAQGKGAAAAPNAKSDKGAKGAKSSSSGGGSVLGYKVPEEEKIIVEMEDSDEEGEGSSSSEFSESEEEGLGLESESEEGSDSE